MEEGKNEGSVTKRMKFEPIAWQQQEVTASSGPGVHCGAGGDTAKSPDGGVTDSFSGRDVASITPFPALRRAAYRKCQHTHTSGSVTTTHPPIKGAHRWNTGEFGDLNWVFTSPSFMYLFHIFF